jgi:hypothetical protein
MPTAQQRPADVRNLNQPAAPSAMASALENLLSLVSIIVMAATFCIATVILLLFPQCC